MSNVKSGERSLKISDEVLARVAGLAAMDVEGVAELGADGGLVEKAIFPEQYSAVEVENLGGAIAVKIRIKLKMGYRAATVAKQVQTAVKQSVQDMTGVTAVCVNVEISGVVSEL